jgi:ankyrin repeat protein
MTLDIDKLRAAAKRLKKAFASGDPGATGRLRTLVPGSAPPKHADFLHVIAREHGYETWPKLKFAVEAAAMSRPQRAERLGRALHHGQQWVVRKLLNDDPDLPDENLGLQIATYDLGTVKDRLARDAAAGIEKIGDRSPILHLAFSKYIHMAPALRASMLEIAALLVAHGADVNDGHPPEPGSTHRLSALYGALGHADNMPLAQWLLEHGANPDDNESLYHATELGHHDGLRLLIKHGVSARGTNALLRALDFNDATAVRLLLEHGADPNEVVTDHPSGEPIDTLPALHQAARRWCSSEIANLLLDHGADAAAAWHGHTPYATARIYGNEAFADALAARGAATTLSATESVLAECASGGVPAHRLDPRALNDEDQLLIGRLISQPVPLDHIKALVAAGIDPDKPNQMGVTPLHTAGWEGLPERMAYLLTLDPSLTHRNAYGGDALGTTLYGAELGPKAGVGDHIACARLLLEAGAILEPAWINGSGSEEIAQFLEDWVEHSSAPAGTAAKRFDVR